MNTSLASFLVRSDSKHEERDDDAVNQLEVFLLLLESCGEEGKIQAELCRMHKLYLVKFLSRLFGDQNRWFTGEEVHHDPNRKELINHLLVDGARKMAIEFCSKFRSQCVKKGEKPCFCLLFTELRNGQSSK